MAKGEYIITELSAGDTGSDESIVAKPCPFCGGEGEIVYNNGYYPTCFNKGCVMYNAHDPFLTFETTYLAKKAWNIRSK